MSFSHIQLHSAGLGLTPGRVSSWINDSATACVSTHQTKLCFLAQPKDPSEENQSANKERVKVCRVKDCNGAA